MSADAQTVARLADLCERLTNLLREAFPYAQEVKPLRARCARLESLLREALPYVQGEYEVVESMERMRVMEYGSVHEEEVSRLTDTLHALVCNIKKELDEQPINHEG